MDFTFTRAENVKCNNLLIIYLRYTHLEIPVFTAILDKIRKMHQTIAGVVSDSFTHPAFPDEKLRTILQIESITTGTSMKSITVVCREGWTPDFQSERDNFLVDIPHTPGIPSIITYLLFTTLDETIVSSSNILLDMKKTLESEIHGNPDVKRIFEALQIGGMTGQLEEQALALIQEAKSTDALRSVSINGFNILSFDINRRKYKRYFVQLPVKVRRNDIVADVNLENISRGGCIMKLSGSMEAQSDQNITIQFPGFEFAPFDVRCWQIGEDIYLRAIFDPPMEESQLRAILDLRGLN
ncbi:MAG: PilZ domain-containing protein [Chitinispirillaceae bacterium]|nr:PilZ domain-containing protein [Chitinispirillaceae bacterium]